MEEGSITSWRNKLVIATLEECAATVRTACGSAIGRPKLTGVESRCSNGNPSGRISGNIISRPITKACTPKEERVVQPRRERWDQEVSSMLSANIRVLLRTKFCCSYGHHSSACWQHRAQ